MNRPRLRRESDTWWTLLIGLVGVVALLVAVIALVAHAFDWSWQPAIVVAALAHQLLWAAPVALVLLALNRRRAGALLALVVVALGAVVEVPLYVGADAPGGGRSITVLQANLKIGAADPDSVVAQVRSDHVDVLMTEELTDPELTRLRAAGLAGLLPYRFTRTLPDGGGGIGLWSRFPLTSKVDHDGYQLGVLSARALVAAGTSVTLFAVHLLPPYPYPPHEWLTESAALRTLLRRSASSGDPVIVAGDFNATTDNAPFRALLGGGYQDAAEHSGAGYLSSYPTDRWFGPIIAIDHVLTHGAPATDARTVALPGSDHRGLLVHVRVGA